MKGSHDIYIIKVGDSYRVRPAVWSTAADGTAAQQELCIRNLTDKQVVVVPPGHPRGQRTACRPPCAPRHPEEGWRFGSRRC